MKMLRSCTVLVLALCTATAATPQQLNSAYGAPIALDNAKKAATAAIAEASKKSLSISVAVVDAAGGLVYFEKMDDAQLGSVNVAIDKARSAAAFKRPTKAFEDALVAGGAGLRILALPGAVPLQGGIPLVLDGKIVGAIGVSGSSGQDQQCAESGAAALK
jgi:uncharacterized protein GlcG (DUF336 family)